jgi:L-threonylcarbamoyladenylate synthase
MNSTRVASADEPGALEEAARLIRDGQLVAFPTETVYGLGANALDPRAVARVFEAKERPEFDPIIVHLADATEVAAHAHPDDAADPRLLALADRFWPGPMTIVVRKRPHVPELVTAGLPTVGLRVPSHPVAQRLIRAADVPIAAPSANRFGRVSPTTAEHVRRTLDGRIPLILDGGPTPVGLESTIVMLAPRGAVLLRSGGLSAEEIEAVVGPLASLSQTDTDERLSPGRLPVHYAPRTPLEIVPPETPVNVGGDERVGLLAADDAAAAKAAELGGPFAAVEILSRAGDAVEAASRLFAALHALDDAGLDRLVAQPVPERGLGRAINDRLRRAAR